MTPVLVGAHMSIAGGLHNALIEGAKIGATAIQIFTANQRQWQARTIAKEEIALWEAAKKETGIKEIISHGSYLLNLGSPKKETLQRSQKALGEEILRCHALKIPYLVIHPGAATGSSEEECLEAICHSLLSLKTLIKAGETEILLETTAGQGSNVGYRFEQLGFIIEKVKKEIKAGVCIDTCHIFCAGYDIRTPKAWEAVLKEFEHHIGLKHLRAMHLNDSMQPLGSRKDRHASLGKGQIGLDCFKFIMQNKHFRLIPKCLETPDGDKYWQDEIKLLKKMAGAHAS